MRANSSGVAEALLALMTSNRWLEKESDTVCFSKRTRELPMSLADQQRLRPRWVMHAGLSPTRTRHEPYPDLVIVFSLYVQSNPPIALGEEENNSSPIYDLPSDELLSRQTQIGSVGGNDGDGQLVR